MVFYTQKPVFSVSAPTYFQKNKGKQMAIVFQFKNTMLPDEHDS
jgi:hypothetical protein